MELLLKMINKKMYSYKGSLKILSHVMKAAYDSNATADSNGGSSAGELCTRMIENGGLKVLFPALMGKVKINTSSSSATLNKKKLKKVNGITYISAEFTGDPKTLRQEADRLRSKLGSAVVVLGSKTKGVKLIAAVTKDLLGRVHAGNLIKEIAPKIGGGGGGRPDMAQAGGKNAAGLTEALRFVETYLENK